MIRTALEAARKSPVSFWRLGVGNGPMVMLGYIPPSILREAHDSFSFVVFFLGVGSIAYCCESHIRIDIFLSELTHGIFQTHHLIGIFWYGEINGYKWEINDTELLNIVRLYIYIYNDI